MTLQNEEIGSDTDDPTKSVTKFKKNIALIMKHHDGSAVEIPLPGSPS
jgi:hypothetical protein